MTPWRDALDRLRFLGYSFSLDGGKLKYAYQHKDNLPHDEIPPLLEVLKTHKAEILKDPCFLIDQTIQEINQHWKPETLEWVKKQRPDSWRRLVELEREINRAALKDHLEGLERALQAYQEAVLGLDNEMDRQVQGSLFDDRETTTI